MDPFETGFAFRQRQYFRPAPSGWPTLAGEGDQPKEKYSLKYTRCLQHAPTPPASTPATKFRRTSYYDQFTATERTLPTGCAADGSQTNSSFYNCRAGWGIVTHNIGSPRQIQMSLRSTSSVDPKSGSRVSGRGACDPNPVEGRPRSQQHARMMCC